MIVNAATVFYNEFDPYAAQWIRNLIAAGIIAPGIVDERSIVDIHPEELQQYAQCHFFAGIGVWSYALRRAGWADDRPVWTGSCPCQPFSAAGAGAGFADQRHLWPHFHYLIERHAEWCRETQRPVPVVLGEQVASKDADPWIDLVQADLEALGYAFGGIPFPSAGIGAPHIRDRLYWVANAEGDGHKRAGKLGQPTGRDGVAHGSAVGGLADADGRDTGAERQQRGGEQRQQPQDGGRGGVAFVGLGDAGGARSAAGLPATGHRDEGHAGIAHHTGDQCDGQPGALAAALPGPTSGYWRAADWLGCRDGKWRPVEPGTFPLVNGPAARVGRGGADWRTAAGDEGKGHRAGRLKGYGNAINAEAAIAWIECVMEAL